MALVVQKYGGTSVGNLRRIANVAGRVAKRHDQGDQIAVVVSAMSGETDRLINMAKDITDNPDERELDVLLSTGEQVTIALLAMTLRSMGYSSRSYCGWQIPLVTDDLYGRARIEDVKRDRILADLNQGHIVIVAGFQGVDSRGSITTLGRGGSDTTAVAVAAALSADVCEIFTDVDGVFTTDPNITSKARKIDAIAYEEMLEMASLGAKVLAARSVEYAMRYGVPLMVRSSFNENNGTLVTKETQDMEKKPVTAVTCSTKEARVKILGLRDQPGVAAQIFSVLADSGIVVDMIIQNSSDGGLTDITFTLPEADLSKALGICEPFRQTLGATDVRGSNDIAKVSVVGLGMRSHSGVASKMFWTLAGESINIEMISTSEIKISCVIRKKYAELAVRSLHEAFELGA